QTCALPISGLPRSWERRTGRPPMNETIHLHIEEIVLHGLDVLDRPALERALTLELERRLTRSHLGQSRHLGRVRGAPITVRNASLEGAELGRALARSVTAILDDSGASGSAVER